MKLEGFSVSAMYEVRAPGLACDLHNDYDFVGCEVDAKRMTFLLSWRRVNASWVREGAPAVLEIEVFGVGQVRFKPASDSSESGGGQTVTFIGHLHPDQWEEMDGCLDAEALPDDFDFIVGFEDGAAIKIRGGRAQLRTGGRRAADEL
jgi:hypothetical protein